MKPYLLNFKLTLNTDLNPILNSIHNGFSEWRADTSIWVQLEL